MAVFLLAPAAAALAACQFNPGGLVGPGDNADQPDADPSAPDASANPIDAGPPDENCGWPFAPRHFDPCASTNPTDLTPLVLGDDGIYIYDTDSRVLTSPTGAAVVPDPPTTLEQDGEVRALWVDGLDIESGSTLRVKGSRPLMIVSTDEIQVRGILDASSTWDPDTLTFDPAAGADPPSDECSNSTGQNGGDCGEGGGGGGGGGFSGEGADGGRGAGAGDCGGAGGTAGGGGGDVSTPATIRGGCKGARGGNGDANMLYGLGGFGGGAVHLVSQTKVDIEGTVQAGGAAGSGAENNRSGGGGGGSGGFIGLEALDIEIDSGAILAANGGAGGGGCNNGLAGSGEDGKSSDQAAIGGTGQSSFGGNGGNGSAGIPRGGQSGETGSRGGGGGGGGGGFIVTYQARPNDSSQAVISPLLTER